MISELQMEKKEMFLFYSIDLYVSFFLVEARKPLSLLLGLGPYTLKTCKQYLAT